MTSSWRRWGGTWVAPAFFGDFTGNVLEDWDTGPSGIIDLTSIGLPTSVTHFFADGCKTLETPSFNVICDLFTANRHIAPRDGYVVAASGGIRPSSFVTGLPSGYEGDRLVIDVYSDSGGRPGTLLTRGTMELADLILGRGPDYQQADEVRFSPPAGPFLAGERFWLIGYPEKQTDYPRISSNVFWDGPWSNVLTDGYLAGDWVSMTGSAFGTLTPIRHTLRTLVAGQFHDTFYPNATDPYYGNVGWLAGWRVDSDTEILPPRLLPRKAPVTFRKSGKLYAMGGTWDHTVTHTSVPTPGGGYTVGGWNIPNNTTEVYDPTSRVWSPLAAMPDNRTQSYFGTLGSGDLIVAGGFLNIVARDQPGVSNVFDYHAYRYDFDTDTWVADVANLGFAHGWGTWWEYGGRLYVADGFTSGSYQNQVLWTDGSVWVGLNNPFITDQGGVPLVQQPWAWVYGPPNNQKYGAAVDSLGRAYLFPRDGFGSAFVRFDPADNSFTNLAQIPHTHGSDEFAGNRRPGSGMKLVDSQDRLWLFNSSYANTVFVGGITASEDVFMYDPLLDVWTQLGDMPEGGVGTVIEHSDGYFYFIASNAFDHMIYKYDLLLDVWTPTGTTVAAYDETAEVIVVPDGLGGYWLVYPYTHTLGYGPTEEGRGAVQAGGASAVEYWVPGGLITRAKSYARIID